VPGLWGKAVRRAEKALKKTLQESKVLFAAASFLRRRARPRTDLHQPWNR